MYYGDCLAVEERLKQKEGLSGMALNECRLSSKRKVSPVNLATLSGNPYVNLRSATIPEDIPSVDHFR